jgi:hypothetical protein
MHQRRRLQRLPRLFVRESRRSELSQLIVHQRQKLLGGLRIAGIDAGQDAGNVGHGGIVRRQAVSCKSIAASRAEYARFGFAPASRWNLTGDYDNHDGFQFLPLTAAANQIRGGHIRYAPEFDEAFGC